MTILIFKDIYAVPLFKHANWYKIVEKSILSQPNTTTTSVGSDIKKLIK